MIKFLEGKTLHEKQIRYYNGFFCPYCDKMTEYVDSEIVYQQSHGMIHYCKDCDAWCGCHTGSDQSYGFVAKLALRTLRHECHKIFDPMWALKITDGVSRKKAQSLARKWMADFMGLSIEEAHIGMFDNDQCKKLIEECKKYYLTPKQIAERKAALDLRVGMLKALCDSLGIEVKEFNLNGTHQIEMKHPDFKKVLLYNPRKQVGWWQAVKPVIINVPDIYNFVFEAFKITAPF